MLKSNKLKQDITLFKRDEYIIKNTSCLYNSDSHSLTMGIILNGNSSYESLVNGYTNRYKKGYTLIDILNKDTNLIITSKDTHKQFIGLTIKKDFLKQNLPNNNIKDELLDFLEIGKGAKNISNNKTNPKTQSLALELFHNPYTNNLEKLYTESKVLEIIYTEFTNLVQPNEIKKDTHMKFTAQDKEAIYHAREILMNNLKNPPSMKELARMIAVNDLKLKKGFHKYFNTTPHSISLEYRLQEAKRLLHNSDLNISEISQEVGYKYSQNFSNAYYKRFGVRPKELMKSRKYYY